MGLVLVVEDLEAHQEAIEHIVTELGHRAKAVDNVAEALALISREGEDFAFAVVDLSLPRQQGSDLDPLGGFEVVEKIKKEQLVLPCCILTVDSEPDALIKAGETRWISKQQPWEKELTHLIEAHLGRAPCPTEQRILIVDSDPNRLSRISGAVVNTGHYQVDEASDVRSALQRIEDPTQMYHLVVVRLDLPIENSRLPKMLRPVKDHLPNGRPGPLPLGGLTVMQAVENRSHVTAIVAIVPQPHPEFEIFKQARDLLPSIGWWKSDEEGTEQLLETISQRIQEKARAFATSLGSLPQDLSLCLSGLVASRDTINQIRTQVDIVLKGARSGKSVWMLVQGQSAFVAEAFVQAASEHALSRLAWKSMTQVHCGSLKTKEAGEAELLGSRSLTGIRGAAGGILVLYDLDSATFVETAVLRRLRHEGRVPVSADLAAVSLPSIIIATVKDASRVEEHIRSFFDIAIKLPTLREQREGLPLLVDFYLFLHSVQRRHRLVGLSEDALRFLVEQDWSGGIEELHSVLDEALNQTLAESRAVVEKVDVEMSVEYGRRPRIDALPGYVFPQIKPVGFKLLAKDEEMLRLLFARPDNPDEVTFKEVYVEQLGEGYSGARLYLTTPVAEGGKAYARVAKIDHWENMRQEQRNFNLSVKEYLSPQWAARLEWAKPSNDGSVGGAIYTLVSGLESEEKSTMEFLQYYASKPIGDIVYCLRRLFGNLDQTWYKHGTPRLRSWAELYSRFLPPLVTIEVDPSSADRIVSHQALPRSDPYVDLTAKLSLKREGLREGMRIQLQGLTVLDIGSYSGESRQFDLVKTFLHSQDQRVDVRIPQRTGRREEGLGWSVSVQGKVASTQDVVLEEAVVNAFFPSPGDVVRRARKNGRHYDTLYDHHSIGFLEDSRLEGRSTEYPNPLFYYNRPDERGRGNFLGQICNCKESIIHGDLNLRNIIVAEKERLPSLIDFAHTGRGQTIYDFVKFESDLYIYALAPEDSGAALSYDRFLELLKQVYFCEEPNHVEEQYCNRGSGAFDDAFEKARETIRTVRGYARIPERNGGCEEYYISMCLTCLGVLKYADTLTLTQRKFAFAAANLACAKVLEIESQ